MWTRKELKERAKETLKRNYWKAVLVSLLIAVLSGGVNSTATSGSTLVTDEEKNETVSGMVTPGTTFTLENGDMIYTSTTAGSVANEVSSKVAAGLQRVLTEVEQMNMAVIIAFIVTIIVFVMIFAAVAVAVDILLINPLLVGAQRFMLKSVDGKGNIAELGYTFDHNFKNGVKTTFYRDLHIFLWALLFIIPGIYKKYQYYMVDFILAENPDMPHKEVLERSKMMMNGQKWNTFVLDLSFILWHMLSFVTCGLSEIFYVSPYIYLTRASLYRALCTDGQSTVVNVE